MKYLHAHATLLLAATLGGLIALGPTGSQGRAAADLGRGRHSTYWCMEHLGATDYETAKADDAAEESAFAEDRQASASTVSDSYDEMDYGRSDSFYGREGDPETYAAATRGEVATDDEYTTDEAEAAMEDAAYANHDYAEGKLDEESVADTAVVDADQMADERTDSESTDYDADRYNGEYADYGRNETSPEYAAEGMDSESTAYDADRYVDHGWDVSATSPEYATEGMGSESTDYDADRYQSEYAEYGRDWREAGPEYEPETMGNESPAPAAERYDSEYADYGRSDVETYPDYKSEAMESESVGYDAGRYQGEYPYQESPVEEKYGYAEEMNGRTSDQESAETAERADEQSNAEMDYANQSPSDVEPYMDSDQVRDEASEQGPASESAWDGGPNEADLEYGKWMPSENNDPVQNEAKATGLEQFGYLPSQLLLRPDQELLGDLRQMADQSSGERQVAFREYVESLGSEAIEFTTQYESATGEEAAMLSEDIASSAAFLAVYRLYEQGELGIDEAIDLLRQTLGNLSQEWIDGVNELAPESEFGFRYPVALEGMTSPASVSAPRALWEALSSWATGRAGQWKTALLGVCTMQLCDLDWHAMLNSALASVDTYPMD